MAEHVPHVIKTPPVTMTCTTSAITGGQLVETVGNMTVKPATANSVKCVGVAARDANVGDQLPVYFDGVHDLTASGAIAAGDLIKCGAAGVAITEDAAAVGRTIGRALEAIADTAKGRIVLGVTV